MGRARVLRAPERTMIAIADAGYSITRSDTAWLEGVLEAARPLLDHGGFIHGYLVDAKARTFRSAAAIQLPEGADFEKHVRHAHPPTGDADIAHAARAANLVTSSAIYGLTGPALAARCFFPDGFGVEDCIALSAADPSGIACMLMGGLPFVGRVAHRDQTRWAHVASHLGAALRLRERLLAAPEEVGLDAADALLDPRTLRVQHGTADTEAHRAAIRSAAELLSARHRGDDAAKLIAAWRALVAGRWSLIDTFDTDGKRFFVLRKNEPTAPGPPLLSPVQRAISAYVAMGHSNKAIAYHLGLSESSISRAVAEICKVLGVASREQLAQLAGALGAHPERSRRVTARGKVLSAPAAAMIAVADAGYALSGSDEQWLEGVLTAARPLLDHGSFVHGWVIDLKAGAFRSCAAIQLPEGANLETHVRHQHPQPGDPEIRRAEVAASLNTASTMWGARGDELAQRAHFPAGFAIADCVMLGATDPSGISCALMGVLPQVSRFSARDQARWGRVASHLASALRLRERARTAPESVALDHADALIDPRTLTVTHAEGEARSHLASIRDASELLAARHGTGDPDQLIAAWRGLVAGRWTLIDTFDTDGKRFFVLRKNEPTAPGPPLLSPVQRAISAYVAMGHSNKAIAYHLGLSESSISRAVAEVCKVLGVPSRAQLAQLAGALGAHPEGADA